MGIFEYECPDGHITEHFVSLANRPDTIDCTQCHKWAKLIVSAVQTTFRAMDRKAFKRSGR